MQKETGSKHRNWRGGKHINSDGYVKFSSGVHIGRPEHRVIMEASLGRELTEYETIHHINGVRNDNRIENLELWSSRHPRGQRVSDLTEWALQHLKLYAPEKLK